MVLLAADLSCSQPPGSAARREVTTGSPARHAMHSKALQRAMLDLDRQSAERLAVQRFTGNTPAVTLDEVAAAAAAIAETAGDIPGALTDAPISGDDQRRFIALADQLQQQALDLYRIAARNDLPAAGRATDRMMSTCNACHAAFRWVDPLHG